MTVSGQKSKNVRDGEHVDNWQATSMQKPTPVTYTLVPARASRAKVFNYRKENHGSL